MKKQENPIGYRPSEDMKALLKNYCKSGRGMSKSRFIEYAMQFFASQGDVRMREIIEGFLYNDAALDPEMKKKSMAGSNLTHHVKESKKTG